MADHNLPTVTSTYTDFVAQLDARLDDITRMLSTGYGSITNYPDGAVQWTGNKWQKWSSSSGAWSDLSTGYYININGSVGATTPSTGRFLTLQVDTSATLPTNTTIGTKTPVLTDAAQTLTYKTLTAPVISSISNGGTITLPTATTTLVGRDTTDTLTNKTLTAPRFADLGFIADSSGNEILLFDSIPSAVNYVAITNSIDTSNVEIQARGDSVNIGINLTTKGTGKVLIDGIDEVVSLAESQTITNKVLGSGSSWQGGIIGVGYGGTGISTAPTVGGILYGSSANAYACTPVGTAGQLLSSGGAAAPAWVNPSTLNVNHATSSGSSAAIANTGGWNITPNGTKLYFNYNGTNVGSLDSSGNFIVTGNIIAYGTA